MLQLLVSKESLITFIVSVSFVKRNKIDLIIQKPGDDIMLRREALIV